MGIIVTTPKSQMANAAQEAADCIEDGGIEPSIERWNALQPKGGA